NGEVVVKPAREMHTHRLYRSVEDASRVASYVTVVRPDHHLAARVLILQDPRDILRHRPIADHVAGLCVVTGSTLLIDLAQDTGVLASETPLLDRGSGDIGSLLGE